MVLSASFSNSFASQGNSTLDLQGNYANPSLGISFQAPQGWSVQEPSKSQPGAPEIAVIAPYSGGFTASISFNIENANGTSLDDYVKDKRNQLEANNQSGDIMILSEQNDTIDGFFAEISTLEENFTAQKGNSIIEFKQATVLANDKFYMITYANDKNSFDNNLSDYDTLLTSIKFTNEASSLFDYAPISIAAGALILAAVIVIKRKRRLGSARRI